MKIRIKGLLITLIVVASLPIGYLFYTTAEMPQQNIDYVEQARIQAIERIKSRPEFLDRVNKEAEKIYYSEMKQEIEEKLKELGGFETSKAEQAVVLKNHLTKYNAELVKYADTIVDFPRWIEIIGIIGTETNYCQDGVGSSRNNCGGIINSQTGKFKHYESSINSIEDIAILLNKPIYQNKSIAEMNGLYCQDESRIKRECKGWTESIEKTIKQITKELS